MKKILSIFATTSALLTLTNTAVLSADAYDAIPRALDAAEDLLISGRTNDAAATLKQLQSTYGANEVFSLFSERYSELKQKTQLIKIPSPDLSKELDNIEKEMARNPATANSMLKKMQADHGLSEEFAKVSDRYNTLKKRIQSSHNNPEGFNASQNVNNLPSNNNAENISKNNIEHRIIQNVHSMKETLPYVQENTLVIVDIDYTLIGHHWATDRQVRLEQDITETLRTIKDEGGHVIALTSRGPDSNTKDQLNEAGISLDEFGLRKFNATENLQNGTGYKEGVFYTNKQKKGEFIPQIVQMYQNAYGLGPTRIIFIDDVKENVEDVIAATRLLSIESVGMVYTGAADLQRENHALYE